RPRLTETVRERLAKTQTTEVSGPCTVAQLLRRQGAGYKTLLEALEMCGVQDIETADEIELQIKYSGYIKRQLQQIGRFKKLETKAIPIAFNYDGTPGFSREVREKLKKVRPASIGQASRISGVTPAAISLLLVAIQKYKGDSNHDSRLQVSSYTSRHRVFSCSYHNVLTSPADSRNCSTWNMKRNCANSRSTP